MTQKHRTMIWFPKIGQLRFVEQVSRNNLLRDNYESMKFLKVAIESTTDIYLRMYYQSCLDQLKEYGIREVREEVVYE